MGNWQSHRNQWSVDKAAGESGEHPRRPAQQHAAPPLRKMQRIVSSHRQHHARQILRSATVRKKVERPSATDDNRSMTVRDVVFVLVALTAILLTALAARFMYGVLGFG